MEVNPSHYEQVSPFRLDVRAFLILIAICCGQFSLIFYLGPIVGFAIGFGILNLTFVALLIRALFIRDGLRSPKLRKLEVYAVRLVVLIPLTLVLLGTVGGGFQLFQQIQILQRKWAVERELGFTSQRRSFAIKDTSVSALQITSVAPGGAFEKAGVREDNIIISELPVDEFLQMLQENRGSGVSLTLATGGGNTPLDKRTQWQATVYIPAE